MQPNPTATLNFRYTWRPSQTRVLQGIDDHIGDRKLHVVAAPGAGKTTLGLEVFRRLGKPALVLSPTRTIRDQWVGRLRDFVPEDAAWPPAWVSTDLDEPAHFTSITYQALHTRYREQEVNGEADPEAEAASLDEVINDSEINTLITRLKEQGVGTLILDEAHHLRAEWWKALTRVLEGIPNLQLVSLTATPPYDVTGSEWYRYEELCGPIDEEISVPELVYAGTLCPHQDYVYAVRPKPEDMASLENYDKAVADFSTAMLHDDEFLRAVRVHPFVANPTPEEVLDAPELAVGLLAYLQQRGADLPKPLLKLMHLDYDEIPELSKRWWQVIIKAYLFKWPTESEHREAVAKRLREAKLLHRRELYLDQSRSVKTGLSLSSAKVQACIDIYQLEFAARGEALRQVVLTDFIREKESGTLGAWPVFEAMVKAAKAEEAPTIGLLTGRLAVVHETRLEALRQQAPDISTQALEGLVGFHKVSSKQRLTEAFTALVNAGQLRVLVGTRALLGEGWDAPSINSLILASFVGSFMLTNQMRGRAIRVDKHNPDKASSIWHLVAVHPETPTGLSDYEELARRFRTFVGLDAEVPVIENGLERLRITDDWGGNAIQANNEVMAYRLSKDVLTLKERWLAATSVGVDGRVIPSIEETLEGFGGIRFMHLTRTLRYLIMQSVMLGFMIASLFWNAETNDLETLKWIFLIGLAAGFLFALPGLIKALILFVRYLPVDGALREIGRSLLDALSEAQMLKTEPIRLSVNSTPLDDGSYAIALVGGTYYEQSLFADCLAELLGPIENPRYLITREGAWGKKRRVDFHAVPQILGTRKEYAELLYTKWQRRVGPAALVYTRGEDGRRLLLEARARAFSTVMAPKRERRDRWQ